MIHIFKAKVSCVTTCTALSIRFIKYRRFQVFDISHKITTAGLHLSICDRRFGFALNNTRASETVDLIKIYYEQKKIVLKTQTISARAFGVRN